MSTTIEAAGLATRMANHFGHKCEVERDGDTTKLHTRVGLIELVVGDGRLDVHADGDEAARVAQSHLERFAREPFELRWSD
jgi:hypothetical protein